MTVFLSKGNSVKGESLYYERFSGLPKGVVRIERRYSGTLERRGYVIVDAPLHEIALGSEECDRLDRIHCRSALFECAKMTRPKHNSNPGHRGWAGYLNGLAVATIRTPIHGE